MMRHIPIERVVSLPSTVHRDGAEVVPQLRHLVRDSAGGLWALGDQLVLFSSDGGNWRDFALNLKADISRGGFTAHAVLVLDGEAHLFVRNWRGLSSYGISESGREWVPESEIDIEESLVAADTALDGLLLLASCKSALFAYRSTDRLQSWTKTPVRLEGVPVYLQLSPLGIGVCCLWRTLAVGVHGREDRSSLYSTDDSGRTWQHVATVDSMILGGCATANGGTLLGGSNGQLVLFDPCTGVKAVRVHSDDVIAVDVLGEKMLALTESQPSPVRNSVLISGDGENWSTSGLQLYDRIDGARLLSDRQAVVCTTREIYLCSLP